MVSDQGIGSCLDAKTGEVIWQESRRQLLCLAAPLQNGLIYMQSEQGDATVIEAGPEYKIVAKNTFGQRTLASYGVTDGTLLIRTSESLYCVQKKD